MECALTGGGAEDTGLVQTIDKVLGIKVRVPGHPQITAALGAACIAAEESVRKE
jgi:activator of 2-hydroxyglutaryl-CoA dehydratase